jgi:hypothetical protein
LLADTELARHVLSAMLKLNLPQEVERAGASVPWHGFAAGDHHERFHLPTRHDEMIWRTDPTNCDSPRSAAVPSNP